MENPHGTLVPKTSVVGFEFKDADGFTIPFVVASCRRNGGKWHACFFWHCQNDQRLRSQILTCFKIWAGSEIHIADLKCVQFFAVKINDADQVSRFKVVGAHRELGHLFPVIFLPLAIAKTVKPAIARLKLELAAQAQESSNGKG